jgi:hypothetical protein
VYTVPGTVVVLDKPTSNNESKSVCTTNRRRAGGLARSLRMSGLEKD